MSEFETKLKRIRTFLAEHNLDALLLRRVSSVAWVTCGATSYVNTATTDGAASALIAPSGLYVITNNIEAPRLAMEEKLEEQGWKLQTAPWYGANDTVGQLTRGLRLGVDGALAGATDVSADLARLRVNLLPEEVERARQLGDLSARAMEAAIRAVRPGQTEFEIAALTASQVQSRGAQAIVNLVATDERIFRFRHPLPTNKKLDRYAMLVLGARQHGLIMSITRLVHFGKIPDEVLHKAMACARVDAAMIAATRPGATLGDVVERAVAMYAETGFADEWQRHHQGGAAGYEPREYLGTPGSQDKVAAGQMYAWNPSITGAKSEDTILVGAEGNEVITTIAGWPMLSVDLGGSSMARPAILEIV